MYFSVTEGERGFQVVTILSSSAGLDEQFLFEESLDGELKQN